MGSSSKISYPLRLFLWLLGYSIVMVWCFAMFQYNREKQFKAAEIDSQLQLINNYVITELLDGHDIRKLNLHEVHPFEDLRLSVISEDGDILYDNAVDSLARTNHLHREEIQKAISKGNGYAVRRHSESTGATYFYSATRSRDGIIVRTAVPYSLSLSTLLRPDFGFLWIMGIIAAIMCVLGFIATRRVGLHITRLRKFALNVEQGAKISDTEPFPNDELGEISNHIVRLYVRLQQANADRDKEHRNALREQQDKERIKKQLTNNINHELKTPVASIRICVETLIEHPDMNADKRMTFLQRCLTACDRLRHLLEDVAMITRMDDGKNTISKERIRLDEVIEDVVADRTPLAHKHGIIINNLVKTPLVMNGNRQLLESAFSNLIDNAIAYSGGTEIKIRLLTATPDKIVLTLQDNGCGVPEEHLTRFFERFYRIDKGRSRAAGGTGLGLSIVKNAVALHGGTITAENLKTGGLNFTITLGRDDISNN